MENKDMRIEPRTLQGFVELMPNEQILFNQLVDKIKASYEKFGFLPLDTPNVELSEILLAKAGGETETQIYRFNKGDTDMSLRFDLTVPLAKYVTLYYNNLSFPFKRYQIGRVYRGERPQKGRYREFYQCDIDIIGDGELSLLNDAEMPAVIYNTFNLLGFGDFTIYINNRKVLNGLFRSLGLSDVSKDVMRIIDKYDKIGSNGVIEELQKIISDEKIIDTIMNFTAIEGNTAEIIAKLEKMDVKDDLFSEGIRELKDVYGYARAFGVPDSNFAINLKIARGLDYYTGTVYETFLNDYKSIGSVCSGGRYDNLAEFYTNKKLPGVGISIGISRLFYQLQEAGLISASKTSIADVLIVPMSEEDIEASASLATYLRNNSINVQVYSENKKVGSKIKYADKLQIPYVVVVGEDERVTKQYTVKNMRTGEQVKAEDSEIVKMIR